MAEPIWLNQQAQHLAEAVQNATEDVARAEGRLRELETRKKGQWEIVEIVPAELRLEAMERLSTTNREIEHWQQHRTELLAKHTELTAQMRMAETLSDQEGRVNFWPSTVGAGSFDRVGYAEWQDIFKQWLPVVEVFQTEHVPRWRLTFDRFYFGVGDGSPITDADRAEAAFAMERIARERKQRWTQGREKLVGIGVSM